MYCVVFYWIPLRICVSNPFANGLVCVETEGFLILVIWHRNVRANRIVAHEYLFGPRHHQGVRIKHAIVKNSSVSHQLFEHTSVNPRPQLPFVKSIVILFAPFVRFHKVPQVHFHFAFSHVCVAAKKVPMPVPAN
jgi:hypothetical protein